MLVSSSFDGFPTTTLQFFANLKANNNREWFNEHRTTFDRDVIEPAQAFILTLGGLLQTLHPGFGFDTRTNGSGSLFRIYRDIRFSKDKTPYKTHLGMKFWLGRNPKKTENPGFYVGIGSEGAGVYAGMWRFTKPMLQKYRQTVDDPEHGAYLQDVLDRLSADGYETGKLHYKRIPRGFDPDHPNADLLKRNAIHAAKPEIPPAVVTSPDFVPTCFEHCMAMWPIVEWLHEHVAQTN